MKDCAGIEDLDKIRDIVRLQSLLCPFQLADESMLKEFDEKKAELRAKTEAHLMQWPGQHGF
jgi:hypothetical protein